MQPGPPPRAVQRATSYHVAQAAGVSQPTVSRSFQSGSKISHKTRAHVLEVAARLGYTPNALARSLITRQSHAVGLVITRYTLNGSPGLLYAMGNALARARKRLILLAVDDDADAPTALADALGYPLDGLITCASMDDHQVQRFLAHGIPVLFFNRTPSRTRVDSISTRHAEGAGQLARALLERGHRKFLCLGGPAQAPVSIARMSGFAAALRKAGVKPIASVPTDFSYQGGHDAFLRAVADSARPQCVFCANDAMAMGVIDACRHTLGWRVPEDVAVAGFDDVPEAARPCYQLTTVRQPIVAMADEAVALLEARIRSPDAKARAVVVDGTLIERASAPLGKPVSGRRRQPPGSPAP